MHTYMYIHICNIIIYMYSVGQALIVLDESKNIFTYIYVHIYIHIYVYIHV